MTLTELSYYSRKLMPVFVLGAMVLLILYFAIRLFFSLISAAPTGPVIYTNPIFGQIKSPTVTDVSRSSALTYVMDTLEGVPITATSAASVYFLPQSPVRFGFIEKIYLMAKTVGIDTEVTKHILKDQEATFNDDKQTLSVNITNFNFSYEYDLKKDSSIITDTRIPERNEIEADASQFLNTMGRYPEELARGKTNLIYLFYDTTTSTVSIVETPEEANMVEVDYYRPDVKEYPIVAPHYFNSQHFVTMVFSGDQMKVVKAQIEFNETSSDHIGIYPLKSGATAFEELKAGKAIIISANADVQQENIKKMFMGYLDPEKGQDYMQPVYVFLGEDNFVAYVPAVESIYLTE